MNILLLKGLYNLIQSEPPFIKERHTQKLKVILMRNEAVGVKIQLLI